MSEEKKFSKEELEKIKEIQKKYVDIQNDLGQISMARIKLSRQIRSLDQNEDQLAQDFDNNQTAESELISSIREKYGDGVLDPKTGTFIPNKS